MVAERLADIRERLASADEMVGNLMAACYCDDVRWLLERLTELTIDMHEEIQYGPLGCPADEIRQRTVWTWVGPWEGIQE